MADERNIERILAYLRENTGRFDLQALRNQLLTTGYAAEDVELAIARFQGAPLDERDAAVAQLQAYIEQNRNQYSLSALRKQLLDAGHPNTIVDEALRRINAGGKGGGSMNWLWGFGFMLLNLIALIPLLLILGAWVDDSGILSLALLGLSQLGLLIAGFVLRNTKRERLGRIILWGMLFSAGAVGLLALAVGICVALVFQGGF